MMIVKVHDLLKNKQAFTLVEVLASVVIISVVLIGAMNLIIFTNKTAVQNNDKLVSINLGKATIEQLKASPGKFLPSGEPILTGNDADHPVIYDKTNCEIGETSCPYTILINDKTYEIQLAISQTQEEKNMKLMNVVVTVELPGKASNKVEGYIYDDQTGE